VWRRPRQVGPSPVDRGRPGCKHYLIVEAGGLPLAVTLTGGHRNDITQLIPLVDAVPPIRGRRGRPRRRPRELFADRGYDHDSYRRQLRTRGITPRIARRGVAHGSGLGKTGGWSNAASPGCTPSSGSASATSAAPTSTSAYSGWPAP
jgi:Transposase DDE domain